jgi:hypothetical protein
MNDQQEKSYHTFKSPVKGFFPRAAPHLIPKLSFLPSPKNWDPLRSGKPFLPEGHRFFPDCLRENWARMIEWSIRGRGLSSLFVNQTFKREESFRSANKKYRIWAGRMKQSLIDRGGSQLRWIRAAEWQIRDVIHFHSLVQGNGLDRLSRKGQEDRWESLDVNTGFCRIYDADLKAAPYLAKYTSKRLGGECEWGGYWQGLSVPISVSCGHSIEHV